MSYPSWQKNIEPFDNRRDIIVPGDADATIDFCVEHFIAISQKTIEDQGYCAVALSGGTTPKAIFGKLSNPPYITCIDWSRILVFWSDERNVPPTHAESNYNIAMLAGLRKVPLPPSNVFRMEGQGDIEQNAKSYGSLIREKIPSKKFDLMMLGMGDDGHTASLFPKTHGLHSEGELVVANYIPKKSSWRMTLTFDCINQSRNIVVYIIGEQKAEMVKMALMSEYDPDRYPIQKVGTPINKALWILDQEASFCLDDPRENSK